MGRGVQSSRVGVTTFLVRAIKNRTVLKSTLGAGADPAAKFRRARRLCSRAFCSETRRYGELVGHRRPIVPVQLARIALSCLGYGFDLRREHVPYDIGLG